MTPYRLYNRPGATPEERQKVYRQLFKARIAEKMLEEIRNTINKARVLGDEHFRSRIENQLKRRVAPINRRGDRKSDEYRSASKIDRV